MTYQLFNRKIDVLIDDGKGRGLDLSQFKIVFKATKNALSEPNKLEISIHNLTEDTASQIMKEFKIVTVQAGYQEGFGVIFRGNITKSNFGKVNQVDTVLYLECGDGERGYNFGMINKTLAKGATDKDKQALIASGLGSEVGYTDEKNEVKTSRGQVFFGLARDYMRIEAQNSKQDVSVQDGLLQFVDAKGTTDTEAVLLSSDSGLIDTPTRGDGVINCRALLMPMIKVGARVKIDEQGTGLTAFNGIYKVLQVVFSGDTFGNDWYSDLTLKDHTQPEKPKKEEKKKSKKKEKEGENE
jgi:hypothetical protein